MRSKIKYIFDRYERSGQVRSSRVKSGQVRLVEVFWACASRNRFMSVERKGKAERKTWLKIVDETKRMRDMRTLQFCMKRCIDIQEANDVCQD